MSTRAFDCVVLDFDGTFTEVDREGEPFLAGYRDDLLAQLGGRSADAWARAEARVLSNPAEFGWEYEGRIVAPSNADPYIRATSIAQIVLDEAGYDPSKRTDVLQSLYRSNYARASVVFREHAKETLEQLIASDIPTFVVTNSHTDAVQQKLRTLNPKGVDTLPVFGDAQKFVVCESEAPTPEFDALPETLTVGGLSRPLFLRRGRYFDVLRRVWAESGATPARTLICGDIFELDLAMPATLGVSTELITRPSTPAYEREAARGFSGGGVAESLDALLERALAK
ncbi:MAG: HAD family hydrolase [Polyangiales bacterium]|nr:HAD family hydrolase [Myxococcales bacterium]